MDAFRFVLRFMELSGSGFEETAVGIDIRIWKYCIVVLGRR